MTDFNKVIFVGTVASDPKMKDVNEKALIEFRLKVGRNYFTVEAWEKTAVEAAARLSQGSYILMNGYAKSESWDDKENPGKKRYATKFTALDIEYLDKKADETLPTNF